MKKIIFILCLLVILSGCKLGAVDTATITTKELYSGSDGIVMNFLENAPPVEVYEGGTATVGLKLQNKGVYDVVDGYLAISSEKTYMEILSSSLKSTSNQIDFSGGEHIIFNLNGKSIENTNGEEDLLTFNMDIGQLEKLSQIHKSTIAITGCYNYKTSATETVCIDSDIYDLKQRVKACTMKDISLTDQGAPVAVTKIETKMLPQDNMIIPQFLITIQNKGKGLVIEKDAVEDACYSEALDYTKLNKVEINVFITKKGVKTPLECGIDKNNKITLKENKAVVRCKYKQGITEEDGVYSTPLAIELDYGYTSTISKNVDIKKII